LIHFYKRFYVDLDFKEITVVVLDQDYIRT